eukprot:SAG31_NODE_3560_length_4122_cov_6.095451_2_plen_209_part_00
MLDKLLQFDPQSRLTVRFCNMHVQSTYHSRHPPLQLPRHCVFQADKLIPINSQLIPQLIPNPQLIPQLIPNYPSINPQLSGREGCRGGLLLGQSAADQADRPRTDVRTLTQHRCTAFADKVCAPVVVAQLVALTAWRQKYRATNSRRSSSSESGSTARKVALEARAGSPTTNDSAAVSTGPSTHEQPQLNLNLNLNLIDGETRVMAKI